MVKELNKIDMNNGIVEYSPKLPRTAKLIRYSTGFIGFFMLAFGLLKFLPRFRHSYTSQIIMSGIPGYLYWPGQLGEILAGILLLYSVIAYKKAGQRNYELLAMTGNLLVLVIMSIAVIVHMDPNVPASVLPARIKEPYIPLLFLILTSLHILYMFRSVNTLPDRQNDPSGIEENRPS